MPVFQETQPSSSNRDLRILPHIAPPLPRLTPLLPSLSSNEDKYEVVVIGAGPAGLFLTLNLSRLGLTDASLLCVDAKPGTLISGQADGLQPRTLEVLKSLGVVSEILDQGCHMSEVAFWNPKADGGGGGIERTAFVPDVACPARYQHEVTIHQGRIERILEENLRLYSKRRVVRRTRFVDFSLDEGGDVEFPVVVDVEQEVVGENGGTVRTVKRQIRTKYLVGADGAHSGVRKAMGLRLEGETTDHIWGVVDFVADTDFPDVRKRCAIHSAAGSVMVIPRERINSGHYLTRLYVQVKEEVAPDPELDAKMNDNGSANAKVDMEKLKKQRQRRAGITLEYIFEQAQRVLSPYHINIKKGTVVDWWAAYQIGQRMTPNFTIADSKGMERVFIVGDACHTHSPKAGQGMNVSMMDSYNLAWKLVHSIHGLSPAHKSGTSDPIVASFEHERLTVARQLIDFDSKFSSMFSGEIGASDGVAEQLTHEQFLKVFSDGNGFTSGCGIEYPEGRLVVPCSASAVVKGDDFLSGIWRSGRRLLNVKVRRFADANLRDLQDDFQSTGRYRILVLASTDLREKHGHSAKALEQICDSILPSFPADTVELVVLHPLETQRFEWTEIPTGIREVAEMRFHGACVDDAYGIYGIDAEKGAVAVVRPDGYLGVICGLEDVPGVEKYLGNALVRIA